MSKQETKTLMIARYRMLECGRNYKGTMSEYCNACSCLDDEEHRLNACLKYEHVNFSKDPVKVSFDTVYNDNANDLKLIMSRIALAGTSAEGTDL